MQIPDYASGLTGIHVERVVEPGDDGYLDVTESARFTGYQAAEMRGQLRTIETSEMQASLQRWIATRYTDAELTDYAVDNIFDAEYDLLFKLRRITSYNVCYTKLLRVGTDDDQRPYFL